jgi:two-component system LytT family response regulator
MTIRVVIVDDEPLAREGIRLRLASEADIVLVGEYGSARQAEGALGHDRPDLLFLDIEMPEEGGIELLRRIGPERVPAVVLVTAHEEHALEAFEVSVVDYVLKPIDDSRFRLALMRARRKLEEHRAVCVGAQLKELVGQLDAGDRSASALAGARSARATAYLSRFLVRVGSQERPINVANIDWIEADGDYARLHCGGKEYLVRETMASLDRCLDPRVFGRIHRSAIVRFERVASLVSEGHGDCEIHLVDGTVLRLSRNFRDRFRSALSHSGFEPGRGRPVHR